jgi:diguanylate cyclase (GGDEF)-like protein
MCPNTVELDWLLEIGTLVAPAIGLRQRENRCARLAQLMAAAVEHLDCTHGALLIPGERVRIVEISKHINTPLVTAPAHQIEALCLDAIRRARHPMLLNRGPIARLLVVPVGSKMTAASGFLLLLRSPGDPPFTSLHLSVARHLSRHVCTLLEANIDPTTGLYTWLGLQHLVESPDAGIAGAPGTHAVICMDIDRLHMVNKFGGFEAGDTLITRVARLLRAPPVPANAAAGRMSGNEFALVLPDVDTGAAAAIARELQQLTTLLAGDICAQPPISLSCGIAAFSHPEKFQHGILQAELACRTAKDHGRGRIEIYEDNDASMIRRDTEIVALQQLRAAMQEDRLTLFAQRITPLQQQNPAGGYELLLRLVDRPNENRAPGALLAAALRTELASELDLWVIEHALATARPYLPALVAANMSLSINLSGPSLSDDDFLQRLRALLSQSRLPPGLIMFEITETVALLSLDKAVNFIRELRTLGCRFALDDFGTGANSLKNLTSLPVDCVKIDGSFVSDILTNRRSGAIVRAMVTLARDLGINTVAEYAETQPIIQRLRELGVEYAQGYGVEKPRAMAHVLDELQARHGPDELHSCRVA